MDTVTHHGDVKNINLLAFFGSTTAHIITFAYYYMGLCTAISYCNGYYNFGFFSVKLDTV